MFFVSSSGCLYTNSYNSRAYTNRCFTRAAAASCRIRLFLDGNVVFIIFFLPVFVEAAEKRPFLESGPQSVKLTPSWEDRNLPAAELNLRGLEADLDKAALDMDPPRDRLLLFIFFYFRL